MVLYSLRSESCEAVVAEFVHGPMLCGFMTRRRQWDPETRKFRPCCRDHFRDRS